MKTFMLCVDALEYDYIHPRRFPHIKQKQYVKVEIPHSAMTIFSDGHIAPFTPVVWKAIFTGRSEAVGPRRKPVMQRWENPVLDWLKRRRFADDTYGWMVRKGFIKVGLPARLGFKRKNLLQGETTFIDYARHPVIVHNPLIADVKWEAKGLREFNQEETVRSQLDRFYREKAETLRRLSEPWDLFIVYTKLLDVMGHLFWQMNQKMEEYYQRIDEFAREIQKELTDTLMLIVSDHGMTRLRGTTHHGGQHSLHAFASFSKEINLPDPFTITDFYPLVKDLFVRQRDDELITDRLKMLGYI